MDHHEPLHLMAARSMALPDDLVGLIGARESAEERFMGRPRVVGVGIGYKIVDGVQSTTPAIMVLVSEKRPDALLDNRNRITRSVESIPTDVLDVGHLFAGSALAPHNAGYLTKVDAQALGQRVRPARPGYSVGHYQISAGTIGAACYDADPMPGKPTKYYVLSNNHVLANSNAAKLGDAIYQPGPYDGGVASDAIGTLARFVPIAFDGSCNEVDAAIAEVAFDSIDRDIYWIGYPSSAAEPAAVGQQLKKTGRTTHFTTGTVTALAATVNINYGNGQVAKFCNQIVTSDMSAGGDSGSLVLDFANRPIGLLFAGSSTATILNPIGLVQSALKVRIWP